MKRSILVLFVIFTLVTGCKKNFTCICSVFFGGTTSTTSTKYNNTKSKATSDCNGLNQTTATQTVTCALN